MVVIVAVQGVAQVHAAADGEGEDYVHRLGEGESIGGLKGRQPRRKIGDRDQRLELDGGGRACGCGRCG